MGRYWLDETVSLWKLTVSCPETTEELQKLVELAAVTIRGTPGGFLPINKHVVTF